VTSNNVKELVLQPDVGSGLDRFLRITGCCGLVQILKDDPKEILRASRDADKIAGYVMDLEKERAPANIEKLPQVERPAASEVARKAPAPTRARTAGGRER